MKKEEFGQFFTKRDTWLTKPVLDFIGENLIDTEKILDPFAGEGDLFKAIKSLINSEKELEFIGFDIDKEMNWKYNDSLTNIPSYDNCFIITNPPYLSKNSCKRNKFTNTYDKYFKNTPHSDLYLIALEKMVNTRCPGIAIVPETLINSKFSKEKLDKIVIIEPNPFEDTEIPVCVVCFNGKSQETKIYKNNDFVGKLKELTKIYPKIEKMNLLDLKFNDIRGSIAIKGFDSIKSTSKIEFLHKKNLNYDFSKIKNSSRAITIVNSGLIENCSKKEKEEIIINANKILNNFRDATKDVLLSPFKGNNKDKKRRRRLDFTLARNILELAYKEVVTGN